MKKITYYRLYFVSHRDGNEGEIKKDVGYFESEIEAIKIASLKLGCYDSEGSVDNVDFEEGKKLPDIIESADNWAQNNLTFVEYNKIKNSL